MSERVTPTYIRQSHEVTLRLPAGLPAMPGSYYRDDAIMRPKSVTIGWDNAQLSVYVHGVTIRKNGTDGVQRQSVRIVTPGDVRWNNDLLLEDSPEWLQDLVARFTPPRPEFPTAGDL